MTPQQIGHDEDLKAWGQTYRRLLRKPPRWWERRWLHALLLAVLTIAGVLWMTWTIVTGIAGP